MKKIGIVGGMGPESTVYYYRTFINLYLENKDSDGNRPEIIIYSVKSPVISPSTTSRNIETGDVSSRILSAIQSLYSAGADFGIIACNSAHQYFDEIQAGSPIPLLSIVTECCNEVLKRKVERVGLFGMRSTVKAHFYQDKFREYGISVVEPSEAEQTLITNKLLSEVTKGVILNDTHKEFLEIIQRMMAEESIEGLILGCTELPLLLNDTDGKELGIPLFDTSKIHVQSALKYSLSEEIK